MKIKIQKKEYVVSNWLIGGLFCLFATFLLLSSCSAQAEPKAKRDSVFKETKVEVKQPEPTQQSLASNTTLDPLLTAMNNIIWIMPMSIFTMVILTAIIRRF